MKVIINKILNEYVAAKRQTFAGHPMGTFFRNEIPSYIYRTGIVDSRTHLITGSVGQGNWATVPWVCIFDRKITTTATKGVYIVYLLAKDGKTLYLTFNQGCTDIRNSHSKADTIKIMRQKAADIASRINARGFASDERIYLGSGLTELAELYQKGTIFYKAYHQGQVPSDEELKSDLKNMMDIYSEYVNAPKPGHYDSWEIVDERTAIKTCDKSFFDYNGSGGPKEICWFFDAENISNGSGKPVTLIFNGKEYSGSLKNDTTDRRRIQIRWNSDLGRLFDTYKNEESKATFTKKQTGVYEITIASGDEEMTVLENVIEALKKLGGKGVYADIYASYENVIGEPLTEGRKAGIRACIEKNSSDSNVFSGNDIFYAVEGKGRGVWGLRNYAPTSELTNNKKVQAIKAYIQSKGFNYAGSLVENFYLGLKSKPFVILAGTSGTGKTRLVRLFAEAINAEYKLVSVRPDWSDSSDLFGHVDLNQKFVPGAVIEFVKQAELNPTKPYFLCLDEMNLARVEYYMSDILSAIETRRFDGIRIVTDPIDVKYGNDSTAAGRYGNVILPGNLYIVGTVNMDETTFPFSKKVLDRANTIEFSYVDLLSMPEESSAKVDPIVANNDFLVSDYITMKDAYVEPDKQYIDAVCTKLSIINGILEIANAHIGYRVRDEIVFYMLYNSKIHLLDFKDAFDNQIMQKILPRVQGSSESIKKMLEELKKLCETEKYESSLNKINFMIKRYDEDGFTSFWL